MNQSDLDQDKWFYFYLLFKNVLERKWENFWNLGGNCGFSDKKNLSIQRYNQKATNNYKSMTERKETDREMSIPDMNAIASQNKERW